MACRAHKILIEILKGKNCLNVCIYIYIYIYCIIKMYLKEIGCEVNEMCSSSSGRRPVVKSENCNEVFPSQHLTL
jgi:hypothetical protein